jgi:hypothetical protein
VIALRVPDVAEARHTLEEAGVEFAMGRRRCSERTSP